MALSFATIDPVTAIKGSFEIFLCGDEHSLIIEQPPGLAIRSFYSWAQNGMIEILGGRMGRAIMVECWIHDSTFATLSDLDDHLIALDERAGAFGELKLIAIDASELRRDNCRFIGFNRVPFDGQRRPEPLPAIGVTDPATYGYWHIAGELHFFQLITD